MKEVLRELVEKNKDSRLTRLVIREYLQARLLGCIQECGAFTHWAFVGGTSLRFLYGMPRFSEDLDFSLTSPGTNDQFSKTIHQFEKVFALEGYHVRLKENLQRTVKSALIKFDGLLFELGLSHRAAETISIKLEIDTLPPAGATFETTVVRRHILLNMLHHDRASLFAGKLHAIFARAYTKGRDIYDLLWYLSDRSWPPPNIQFLNNGLEQTSGKESKLTQNSWRPVLKRKIASLDWPQVIRDVKPFLEKPEEEKMLQRENVLKLI